MLRAVLHALNAHDALEHELRLRCSRGLHGSRAVDEVNAAEEGDVLPHLGLPRNGGHRAHLLFPEGVDDGGLAHVGIAHEPDGYGLLVCVELGELPEQVDERGFPKGVCDRGVECYRGRLLGQHLDPVRRHLGGEQVALVEHEDEVLVRGVAPNEGLDVQRAGAHGVAGVKHLHDHVRRVNHPQHLPADAPGHACLEDLLSRGDGKVLRLVDVGVTGFSVVLVAGVCELQEARIVPCLELGTLALFARAEGGLEGLGTEEVHARPLLRVFEEAHGQLVLLDEHTIRVADALARLLPERLHLLLAHDPRVAEPPAVRLDARREHVLHLLAHAHATFDDLPGLVTLHLGPIHVEAVDRAPVTQLGPARLGLPGGRAVGRGGRIAPRVQGVGPRVEPSCPGHGVGLEEGGARCRHAFPTLCVRTSPRTEAMLLRWRVRGARALSSTASRSAQKVLTSRMHGIDDPSRALRLYEAKREAGDDIFLATTWTRVAKLLSALDASARERVLAREERVVSLLQEGTLKRLDQLHPRSLANIVFASASMSGDARARSVGVLRGLSPAVVRHMDGFSPQGLSNVLWGYARAEDRDSVFRAASQSILRRNLAQFSDTDLAGVAWAFAAARQDAKRVFARIASTLRDRSLRSLSPRNLASLASSYARADRAGPGARHVVASLARAGRQRLAEFKAMELCMLAWACAMVSYEDMAILRAMAERCTTRALDVRDAEMAMAAWALGRTGGACQRATEELASAAAKRADTLSPSTVAVFLWALAKGGERSSTPLEFLEAGERSLLRPGGLDGCDAKDMSTMLWALSVLDKLCHVPCLTRSLVHRVNQVPIEELTLQDRSSLYQVHIALMQTAPDLRVLLRGDLGGGRVLQDNLYDGLRASLPVPVPPSPVAGLRTANDVPAAGAQPGASGLASRPSAPAQLSRTHALVSEALTAIGVDHVNCMAIPGLGYFVDIVLLNGRTVIEIAGPHHYVRGERGQPGAVRAVARMKWRQLNAAGWRVVHLPYFQLDRLLPRREADGDRLKELRTYLLAAIKHRDSDESDDVVVSNG